MVKTYQKLQEKTKKERLKAQAREWAVTADLAVRYQVTPISIGRYEKEGRIPPAQYPLGPHRKMWRFSDLDVHDKAAAARHAAQMAADNAAEAASAKGKALTAMRKDRQTKTKTLTDTKPEKPAHKPARPHKSAAEFTEVEVTT
jgi:hypothetical protein